MCDVNGLTRAGFEPRRAIRRFWRSERMAVSFGRDCRRIRHSVLQVGIVFPRFGDVGSLRSGFLGRALNRFALRRARGGAKRQLYRTERPWYPVRTGSRGSDSSTARGAAAKSRHQFSTIKLSSSTRLSIFLRSLRRPFSGLISSVRQRVIMSRRSRMVFCER